MSDILQHGFARYGKNTGMFLMFYYFLHFSHVTTLGTRTMKKAASAEKKRDIYYSVLGRILAKGK